MGKSLEKNRTSTGYWRCTSTRSVRGGLNTQQVFSLGKEERAAEIKLIEIEYRWKRDNAQDAQGRKVWSEAGLNGVLRYLKQGEDSAPAPAPVAATPKAQPIEPLPRIPKTITMFYEGIDLFLDTRRKQLTGSWLTDIEVRLESIKRHIPDCPLNTIDDNALEDMRIALLGKEQGHGRPHRKRQEWTDNEGKQRQEKPRGIVSLYTSRNWLMTLGMVFDYFHNTRRIDWTPENGKWREHFQVSKNEIRKLLTPDEKYGREPQLEDGRPAKMYNLEELTTIYKAASGRQRMYILFGVLLGYKNKDISDLCRYEIKSRKGEMFIVKERGKTGVQMDHWIAPELMLLIGRYADTTDPSPKAMMFRTDEQYPLVHNRTDNIRASWERLMYRVTKETAKVKMDRILPYSTLRRLGGQLVENVSGSKELAQVLLAHADGSVARQHYIGLGNLLGVGKSQFERLHDVQKEIHKLLKPMLEGAEKKTPEQTDPATRAA